jgi:membrane protein required for colicin V production
VPNWLDILLGIILIASVIEGFKKGLARTGLGFLAVIVGLVCGLWFYGAVGNAFAGFIHSRSLANLVGFLAIFIGAILLGGLVGALIAKLMKVAHLSWLDRVLGGAFGVLRGALVGAVILLVMTAFSPKPPPLPVAHSRIAPYVMNTARLIVYAAPREFREGFRDSYDKLRRFWADVTNHKEHPDQEEL